MGLYPSRPGTYKPGGKQLWGYRSWPASCLCQGIDFSCDTGLSEISCSWGWSLASRKPVPSLCVQGFNRVPSIRKRSHSYVKQSSGAAEVDTVGRKVSWGLRLTWQVLLSIRPSMVCTTLSLDQIRCHLSALSPYSITPWQLSQDHYFLLPHYLLCLSSSFSFCFLLLLLPCTTASGVILPQQGSSRSRSIGQSPSNAEGNTVRPHGQAGEDWEDKVEAAQVWLGWQWQGDTH